MMEELNKGYEFTKAQIAELESLRAENEGLKKRNAGELVDVAATMAENETLRARLAEIEKQEPVCWMTPSGEGWMMRTEPPVTDTKLGWTTMFATPVVSPDVSGKYDWLQEQHLKVIAENQSLKTELEAARKDAERYRWICSDDRSSHDVAWLTEGDIFYKGKCDIDSAIDAAIEQAKGGV